MSTADLVFLLKCREVCWSCVPLGCSCVQKNQRLKTTDLSNQTSRLQATIAEKYRSPERKKRQQRCYRFTQDHSQSVGGRISCFDSIKVRTVVSGGGLGLDLSIDCARRNTST